jgi:PKD repeat protein
MFYCIECIDEVWVDDNYNSTTPGWNIDHVCTIQSGIDKVCPYGTVFVYNGKYTEDIIIPIEKKGILLRGEDIPVNHNNRAVIEGTITIYADSITVNYFCFNCTTNLAIEKHVEGTKIMYNVFEFCCINDNIAIYADELVDAEYNYWGAPNGPNGGIMDDGYIAKGFGCQVIGPVFVEPWVGVFAKGKASLYSVELGESVVFNADNCFAADFNNTYEPEYQWMFEPMIYSNEKQISHSFNSPNIYEVSLRVQGYGIANLYQDFMYDWTYLLIEVTSPFTPLCAYANGDNPDGYQAVIGKPITLQGRASGGFLPYSYSWDLGDGNLINEQNPTCIYKSEGNYTLILTVFDNNGNTATDIATIEVIENQEVPPEIKNIKGNFGRIKATIVAGDTQVNWSISIDGRVLLNNEAVGTIPANVQSTVKLPFKIGFGNVDITITANTVVEVRGALIVGPFIMLYE